MSALFEIDAAGDTNVRQTLARDVKGHKSTPKMSSKQKKRRLLEQERELSQLVFESTSEVPAAADSEAIDDDAEDDDGSEEGGSEEEDDVEEAVDDDSEPVAAADEEDARPPQAAVAAWVDEDDEDQLIDVSGNEKGKSRLRKLRTSRAQTALGGAEYAEKLRCQFQSVQPDVAWAALPEKKKKKTRHTRFDEEGEAVEEEEGEEDDDADEFDDIMRSTAPLLGASVALPVDTLSIRKLTDLNVQDRSASLTPCVQWHPNGKLALTAGPDKTLRLFRSDGSDNAKLQSIHLSKLPVHSAAFSHDGGQIFLVGKCKQWATFDLHSGAVRTIPGLAGRSDKAFSLVLPCPAGGCVAMLSEGGALLLVSSASKQLLATLQPSGGHTKFATQCAAFSADGAFLYSSGEGSAVRVWDVKRRCCVHTWNDRGGLRVTALAASADGQHIAVGSDSGAVNLYLAADTLTSAKPHSQKEFLNLTSAITTVGFNPTSELLAFASKYTRRAMRVAHVAAGHVFANWPTGKTPLGYVQAIAFAPHSGYVAIGNDQGKVLMYQMNHFAGM